MMTVESIGPNGVSCTVNNSNEIGERKGVNLPGVVTGLPAMSEKDKVDIRYGVQFDTDFIAASFVSTSNAATCNHCAQLPSSLGSTYARGGGSMAYVRMCVTSTDDVEIANACVPR
jgi:hypothetical protein